MTWKMHINNIRKVNASTYRHRVQTRRFDRQHKKLHDNVATDVDDAVELIARKPSIGE
ncbi:MAG: type II toxin-antitoxin system RelE/ParE family toxin [Candidatus Nitrotoga sp.]